MRRKNNALCERPFALHRQQPEKHKQNFDVTLMEKFLRTPVERGLGTILTNLLITATSSTAERSFSKLRLIKTFHRSTTSDEKVTTLAMISNESEFAKTLDMTELTKTFPFLKTWKKSLSMLETSKCLSLSAL